MRVGEGEEGEGLVIIGRREGEGAFFPGEGREEKRKGAEMKGREFPQSQVE